MICRCDIHSITKNLKLTIMKFSNLLTMLLLVVLLASCNKTLTDDDQIGDGNTENTMEDSYLSGIWQGVVYQDPCGQAYTIYPSHFEIDYTSDLLSGFWYIETDDRQHFAYRNILPDLSTVDNDSVTLATDSTHNASSVHGWFQNMTLEININEEGTEMTGRWYDRVVEGQQCFGDVELRKLKFLTNLTLCKNEQNIIEVDGINVNWYKSATMVENLGSGNSIIIKENLSSIFITQTISGVESTPYKVQLKYVDCN